jgi:hypothetical protein
MHWRKPCCSTAVPPCVRSGLPPFTHKRLTNNTPATRSNRHTCAVDRCQQVQPALTAAKAEHQIAHPSNCLASVIPGCFGHCLMHRGTHHRNTYARLQSVLPQHANQHWSPLVFTMLLHTPRQLQQIPSVTQYSLYFGKVIMHDSNTLLSTPSAQWHQYSTPGPRCGKVWLPSQ